jgi:hypothetical protein
VTVGVLDHTPVPPSDSTSGLMSLGSVACAPELPPTV